MDALLLDKIQKHSILTISRDLSDKMVYHDIAYAHRVISAIEEISEKEEVSDEDKRLLLSAGWLLNIGFTQTDVLNKVEGPEDLFSLCYACSIKMGKEFLAKETLSDSERQSLFSLMEEVKPGNQVESHLGKILSDAITSDWGQAKSKGKIKKLYNEFLLTGAVSYGKSTWYDTVLSYLREHQFYTNYGQEVLAKGKIGLLEKIQKEKKELDKKANTLLQKEMKISDAELKKLKKSLTSVIGRDDRGIQTMFRTTSRNHYTLNQMVDRKASIMISINAILLSLIISRTIGQIDTFCVHNTPIIVMLLSSIISMILAVVAITPFKTQGTFTEAEIREKQGNLLYYGNFHNMNFRDFEWGMLQMLNDGKFLYSTMIRDLYFLGQTLHKKSSMIRLSLGMFILGLIISTILFFIVSSMDDFHFGNAAHI